MRVYKEVKISSAHQLKLPYDSKCNRLHGHNYRVEIWIDGRLNEEDMVIDFTEIKKAVDVYDHKNLNDFFEPTTTENFCMEILETLVKKLEGLAERIKVRIWESDTGYAEEVWQCE